MQNLIETWLATEASIGNTQADAIRQMNKVLQCNYTSSRVNEWLRGERYPDYPAYRYLVMQSIVYAMMQVEPKMVKAIDGADMPEKLWRLTKAITLG